MLGSIEKERPGATAGVWKVSVHNHSVAEAWIGVATHKCKVIVIVVFS